MQYSFPIAKISSLPQPRPITVINGGYIIGNITFDKQNNNSDPPTMAIVFLGLDLYLGLQ